MQNDFVILFDRVHYTQTVTLVEHVLILLTIVWDGNHLVSLHHRVAVICVQYVCQLLAHWFCYLIHTQSTYTYIILQTPVMAKLYWAHWIMPGCSLMLWPCSSGEH